ncbi:MAG: LLM class flavin-dependent oxidoreductase, partial [Aeromicrobium sp.]
VESGLRRSVIGTPSEAAARISTLAEKFGVDEVMVNPVASAHRGADPRTADARNTTLALLAKELI